MALLFDHQAISINAGTRNFGPVTIPDGLTRITLRLARMTTATPTLWSAGVDVKLDSWCSIDGGATWLQWLGFGSTGGIYVKGNGTEATESSATANLPEGTSRLMRLTATVTGGRFVSQLTVEAV
jgi:hypothetical protein